MSSIAGTFAEIEKKARRGDVLAQAQMEVMYQLGWNGINKDTEESAKWILKAANQGLVEAEMFMVALLWPWFGREAECWHGVAQWHGKAAAQST